MNSLALFLADLNMSPFVSWFSLLLPRKLLVIYFSKDDNVGSGDRKGRRICPGRKRSFEKIDKRIKRRQEPTCLV